MISQEPAVLADEERRAQRLSPDLGARPLERDQWVPFDVLNRLAGAGESKVAKRPAAGLIMKADCGVDQADARGVGADDALGAGRLRFHPTELLLGFGQLAAQGSRLVRGGLRHLRAKVLGLFLELLSLSVRGGCGVGLHLLAEFARTLYQLHLARKVVVETRNQRGAALGFDRGAAGKTKIDTGHHRHSHEEDRKPNLQATAER